MRAASDTSPWLKPGAARLTPSYLPGVRRNDGASGAGAPEGRATWSSAARDGAGGTLGPVAPRTAAHRRLCRGERGVINRGRVHRPPAGAQVSPTVLTQRAIVAH